MGSQERVEGGKGGRKWSGKNVWAIKTILKIIKKPIAKVTSFFSTGV